MEIVFTEIAFEHLQFFQKNNKENILKKIRALLESINETPYHGAGKPEAFKYNYAGYWSRRITKEHRLIYRIDAEKCIVYSLKGHYE